MDGPIVVKQRNLHDKDKGTFPTQLFVEYLLVATLFGGASLMLVSTMRDRILTSLSTLTSSVEHVKSPEPDQATLPPDAKSKNLQLGINAMQ